MRSTDRGAVLARRSAAAFVSLLISAAPGATASLAGRVLDPAGLPVATASLRLSRAATPARTLITDSRGGFRASRMDAGTWSVEVLAEGFTPQQLTLQVGSPARLEIRLVPEPPPGVDSVLLALVREADAAFASGDWVGARDAYQRALERRPVDSLTLHLQIARCLGHLGEFASELAHLQLRLDAEPDNPGLRSLMAQESVRAGELARAMALLDGIDGAAARDPHLLFGSAAILLNQGHAEAALPLLDRTLLAAPDFPEGLQQRGLLLLRLGRFDAARRDLERLLVLQPQHPDSALLRRTLTLLPDR